MRFGERTPYLIERIVVSLSYLTMGFIGFIWLILGAFTKSQSSDYVHELFNNSNGNVLVHRVFDDNISTGNLHICTVRFGHNFTKR